MASFSSSVVFAEIWREFSWLWRSANAFSDSQSCLRKVEFSTTKSVVEIVSAVFVLFSGKAVRFEKGTWVLQPSVLWSTSYDLSLEFWERTFHRFIVGTNEKSGITGRVSVGTVIVWLVTLFLITVSSDRHHCL